MRMSFAAISRVLRYRFDLSDGQADAKDIIESIRQGIEFKGTNLWTLVFAIFIASVGLNMNSTAVVIGAMLISPLMGPIMGIGLGAGIYDLDLIKKAGKNLVIMMVVSLMTSTLYFLLSPLKEAQPELLARTTPSIWDVIIAFSGGLAGIIAATRRLKGNVIAGVAIATALMPPLCTAGYGLATAHWYYFLGAIYLFFINTVFISFSTVLVVRIMRFPHPKYISPEMEKQVRRNVSLVVFLTVLPSLAISWFIVNKAIFESRTNAFVQAAFSDVPVQVLRVERNFGLRSSDLELYTIGEVLDSQAIHQIQLQMPVFGLDKCNLEIRQGATAQKPVDLGELRTGILDDLFHKNEQALVKKEERIQVLEKQLSRYGKLEGQSVDIAKELNAIEPGLLKFTINNNIYYDLQAGRKDTLPVVGIQYSKNLSSADQKHLYDWLKLRIHADSLVLIRM